MAETDGQEKTEQPTSKKLTEGREKGQVAKSMEINSLVIFTSGLMFLYFTNSMIGENISKLTIKIFNSLDVLSLDFNSFQLYVKDGLWFMAFTIVPIFLGLFITAFTAAVSQVGFKMSLKAMTPKAEKFNILKGIKRVFFSPTSFVEVLKSLLKLALISAVVYYVMSDLLLQSTNLIEISVSEITAFMIKAVFQLTWKIAIIYALFAAVDFIYQKYSFKKQMMMTKQEIKEEVRQTEGDPFIKSRIRKIQHSISRSRMMQEVAKADVVITNPTHYAIALKYDLQKDAAPRVLAKGADELARKIKKIAAEHNIPMHEDRELARALYKFCDVGDVIPEKLFKAVAQILAYVYQLRKSKKRRMIV
ncbi:MAG: flagellar biosynthesis protein FlhB [Ignavibacteriaceae bacterium]